jgi:hypothetical protein
VRLGGWAADLPLGEGTGLTSWALAALSWQARSGCRRDQMARAKHLIHQGDDGLRAREWVAPYASGDIAAEPKWAYSARTKSMARWTASSAKKEHPSPTSSLAGFGVSSHGGNTHPCQQGWSKSRPTLTSPDVRERPSGLKLSKKLVRQRSLCDEYGPLGTSRPTSSKNRGRSFSR